MISFVVMIDLAQDMAAHMQVIAENIKNGGDLNAMVPGQKVSYLTIMNI
jgi:hypothetical protein